MSQPTVIIIGAGFTGVATAHDLALRGCQVTVVERGAMTSGTSGRTHGLLHSGARYAVNDQESAIECIDENTLLRKIVPEVFEPNGGLFIALNDSDMAYREVFIAGTQACHIPIEELTPQQALRLEPNLNPKLLTAFHVPDATFDPLRLALAFAATARSNGAQIHEYVEVTDLLQDGQGNVTGVQVWDRRTNQRSEMHADIVVSATGAWAGEVAAMAGADVPITPTPGVMVAYNQRLVERTINRLNKPDDGDIVLPQRRMVVVGTTSFQVEDLDYIPVYEDQVQMMLERGSEMIPGIRQAKERGAWMASRPLVGKGTEGRSLARTFKCFDHQESHSIGGFVTITGGKATTCRAMAETTADVVARKLGLNEPCRTREVKLLSYRDYYRQPV